MAPQRICRRALLPALGLGVLAAMTAATHAQDYVDESGLMFVKRLIMSPTAMSAEPDKSTIETETPPPPKAKGFYETELVLRSSEPDGAGGITRVIKGVPSKAGYWKSAVNIEIGKGLAGPSSCGAAVIDRRWVLTAAHCVFDQKRGGLRPLQYVTVFEGSHEYQKGRQIRVAEVHVHKQFKVLNQGTDSEQLIYDVALLKLEKDAEAPRQKLAAHSGSAKFLATGNIATVVGWGKTEKGKGSEILLQADVPIVGESACHGIYPQVGQMAFCAGYKQGGVDTCQGDSGGPLYVSGPNGEHIQAGLTSFGKGCALPDAYGVYTHLGLFEQWIKERVPSAYFVQAPSGQTGSYLEEIAGFKLGGAPSSHGQVSVDLLHVTCPGTAGADVATQSVNEIKPGSCVRVRVTSGVTGHIRVYSLNSKGKVHTMFPNPWSSGEQVGATDGSIQAGKTIGIPSRGGDNFFFKVDPVYGKAHVIALVVGPEVSLPKIAEGRALERSTEEFVDELAEISRQITAHPLVPRAVGTRQYEVVE
jgi:secreted trypsin-like serine protease